MKLKKISKQVMLFFEHNLTFIVLMLLLNFTAFFDITSFGKGIHHFIYVCFVITFISIIINLIPLKRYQNLAKKFFIVLSIIVLIFNLYFAYYYQGLPDQAIMEVLLATNKAESIGYIKSNLLNIWLYVIVILGLFVFYGITKIVKLLHRNHIIVVCFSILLSFSVPFTIINLIKDVIKNKDKTINSLTHKCCSVITICAQFVEATNNMRHFEVMLRNGNSHPKLLSNKSSIPYFIYILGESTSRHHLGIYGYHLNTTPYMASLEKTGDLIKFTDVISPNGQTMQVLGKLFTFYRQKAKGEWYQYEDLFSILNSAGYNTIWLSNQESSGIYGNNGRVYAERCKEHAFTRLRGSTNSYIADPLDEELLPLLDKSLKRAKKKNFIVLHLMGTHAHYNSRYPKTFKEFSPSVEVGETDKIKQTKAEYDTAVRYNDSIINEIIKRFKDKNAIIIYTSDHGEDVMEINKKIAGHSDIDINRRTVEIPMLVYLSKKFQVAYPSITKRIRMSANRPFMTDDMIQSILDIIQVTTKDYRPELSIFNPVFNEKRIRYCGKNIYKK